MAGGDIDSTQEQETFWCPKAYQAVACKRGPKPGHGRRPRTFSVKTTLTMPANLAEAVEAWRERQPRRPKRSQAIVQLIARALGMPASGPKKPRGTRKRRETTNASEATDAPATAAEGGEAQ